MHRLDRGRDEARARLDDGSYAERILLEPKTLAEDYVNTLRQSHPEPKRLSDLE